MSRVLISGGSGLIGQHLCKKLLDRDYEVAILSRSSGSKCNTPSYFWDINRNEIDKEAINSCDFIIHLAGVNIGAQRWSKQRKEEILNSRVESTNLIYNNIDKKRGELKAFISASAIGYYGALNSEHIFSETDDAASDFLGETCKLWEQAADRFVESGIRTVKVRTGLVLSKKGGALSKLLRPAKLGLASAIGSGKQYMPWIHVDDLCEIYIQALENETMRGAYNAVAPEHIRNRNFTRRLARKIHRPFWFPNIPTLVMKIIFGEMSALLLTGSRISSEKIQASGFKFRFPDLDSALNDLCSK